MVQSILPHRHHHCHRHCRHLRRRPGMSMALVALEHELFDLLRGEGQVASVRLEGVQDPLEPLSSLLQ